jgi:hypothetical protein
MVLLVHLLWTRLAITKTWQIRGRRAWKRGALQTGPATLNRMNMWTWTQTRFAVIPFQPCALRTERVSHRKTPVLLRRLPLTGTQAVDLFSKYREKTYPTRKRALCGHFQKLIHRSSFQPRVLESPRPQRPSCSDGLISTPWDVHEMSAVRAE